MGRRQEREKERTREMDRESRRWSVGEEEKKVTIVIVRTPENV